MVQVHCNEGVATHIGPEPCVSARGGKVAFTYDPLSRPTGATFADKTTLDSTWNLAGRLTKLVDSVGGTVGCTYDGLDRLLTETTAQGTGTCSCDKVGNVLTPQAGSQAQTAYSYDAENRPIGSSDSKWGFGRRLSVRFGLRFWVVVLSR